MRGHRYTTRENAFFLQDLVFIIDGLQRTTALKIFGAQHPDRYVRLGVTVYFDTTKEWERERFNVLNSKRVRVSANKLMFNMRETSPAVAMLHSMTGDRAMPIHDRITWRQNQARTEFFGAVSFAKAVCMLHRHKANGLSSDVGGIVKHLERIMATVGKQVVRDNIRSFYELIDECWHIRSILHKEKAGQLKLGFQLTLARFLSDHHDFWKGEEERRLFIELPLKRKFAQYSLFEPTHAHLCGAGGKTLDDLYKYLGQHMDRGKRTKRLSSRKAITEEDVDISFDTDTIVTSEEMPAQI